MCKNTTVFGKQGLTDALTADQKPSSRLGVVSTVSPKQNDHKNLPSASPTETSLSRFPTIIIIIIKNNSYC